VRKRKTKAASATAVFIACGLSPDLRDSLKLLSASRKAQRGKADKPSFLNGILDEAITKLAAMLKSGVDVSFIPVPRNNTGRTSFRISPGSHKVALKASETADVKLSDFIRTAISLYVRSHAREIYQEAKTASHRVRKPARR
jgi:hypothetical protein